MEISETGKDELGDRMEISSFPDIKIILQSPVRHEY